MEEELGWIAMMVGVFVLAMASVALQGFFSNLGSHAYHKFISLLWGHEVEVEVEHIEEESAVGPDEEPEPDEGPECTIGSCWAGPGGVNRVERSGGVCRGVCMARSMSAGGVTSVATPTIGGAAVPSGNRAGVHAVQNSEPGEPDTVIREDGAGDFLAQCHSPTSRPYLETDGDPVEE